MQIFLNPKRLLHTTSFNLENALLLVHLLSLHLVAIVFAIHFIPYTSKALNNPFMLTKLWKNSSIILFHNIDQSWIIAFEILQMHTVIPKSYMNTKTTRISQGIKYACLMLPNTQNVPSSQVKRDQERILLSQFRSSNIPKTFGQRQDNFRR